MSLSIKNNDAVLVSLYINGDEKSLEKLIIKHKAKIYNFIYSKILNRDTSEDIFQETFIKVIKTLKRGVYNEEGKFLPWVMRIAHNLVLIILEKVVELRFLNLGVILTFFNL